MSPASKNKVAVGSQFSPTVLGQHLPAKSPGAVPERGQLEPWLGALERGCQKAAAVVAAGLWLSEQGEEEDRQPGRGRALSPRGVTQLGCQGWLTGMEGGPTQLCFIRKAPQGWQRCPLCPLHEMPGGWTPVSHLFPNLA